MKNIFLFAALLIAGTSAFAQHTIKKLWSTDTVLAIPESVLFDKDVLYVTLIDGQPWESDGKGAVAKVSTSGKILNSNWVSGLNAPKGMAKVGNFLYVADMSEVAVIDIAKGTISKKIPVEAAIGLNDVTADQKGIVYVTDSKKGLIYKIENDKASLFMEGISGINGIKAIGDKLYILGGDGVYVSDAAKIRTKLGVLEFGGDGIEPVGNGDFIVTSWSGYLYYFYANGKKDIMLDTHTTTRKTADIGYDPATRTIYVPTFLAKGIDAYRVD